MGSEVIAPAKSTFCLVVVRSGSAKGRRPTPAALSEADRSHSRCKTWHRTLSSVCPRVTLAPPLITCAFYDSSAFA